MAAVILPLPLPLLALALLLSAFPIYYMFIMATRSNEEALDVPPPLLPGGELQLGQAGDAGRLQRRQGARGDICVELERRCDEVLRGARERLGEDR